MKVRILKLVIGAELILVGFVPKSSGFLGQKCPNASGSRDGEFTG